MGHESSFNKAWDAAHAGKPLRDLAHTDDISVDERIVLENIADRAENRIFNNKPDDDEAPEKNNHEQMLLKEAIELVKHNLNFQFGVFAIGNVLAKQGNDTIGGEGYLFDQGTQKMNPNKTSYLNFLDGPLRNTQDKIFQPEWHKYKFDNGVVCIASRIPIAAGFGPINNPYITDLRRGCHISFALGYKEKNLDSLENKEIVDKLAKIDTKFLGELFISCAKEFIPDYWNYVLKLRDKYIEQHKK